MEKGLVQEINRKHVSRRRWRKFWSLMAATAAFCTTYVLILPAITMSRQLVCGKEEHSHIEACYEQQTNVICGLEAVESHTHTDTCYTQNMVWTCGLEETEGHSHTDSCYETQTVNTCGQEETEGHSHTEGCYEKQTVNTCGLEESEEHSHTDTCWEEQSTQICGLEEVPPHTHTESCTAQEQQLICGQEEVQPHTHSEACSGVKNVLTCTLPERLEGHTHTDSCYDIQTVMVCTLEEHTHNEFCYDVGPADANADVEMQEDWEKAFSKLELTEHRDENVTAVALTQLGYRESERNYIVVDELTLNGYTRYGAWYGDPYGDWDAMFASFVLHYAEVDDFGKEQDPAEWAEKIAGKTPDRFQAAGAYQPGIGDLVFFDRDLDDEIDGVGILMEATESTWRVIEGNKEDAVSLESYAPGDNRIKDFAVLGADQPVEENTQPSEDPTEDGTGDGETEPTTETTGETTGETTAETTGEKTEYTVTYLANNGTEETAQQKASGEVILTWEGFTAPEGKILVGWNTAPDGTGTNYPDGEKLTPTEDVTLYAQWITGYTVTYLANNGTEETAQQKASGEVTLTWEGFTAPEGKILVGWNTAIDGTGTDYPDGEELTLTEDVTLYAQWITGYTVTYMANNGTEETAQQKASGEVILTWEGFTAPEGKILVGWNTAPDGTGTNFPDGKKLTPTEDVTLYAQWVPGYTVTYLANNGTEETAQQKASGEVTLSWEGFTVPEGKILISWNTSPDGTGTDYDDGETLTLTENMALYAQWIDESLVSNLTSPLNVTRATGSIALKKQIEKLNTSDVDDYSYRLHLTLDGSTLSAGSTTTVTPTKQRHIGILLDVTETMTATSDWGSNGENKFDAVRSLLEGNDGFLNSLLDGNTYVSVIVVGGQSGYGTYETLSKQIAAGDKAGDFSNINNDLHLAQGISYVTGLKAAEKFLGNDIDSLVYIVGNNPDTHIKYSDGTLERGTSGNNAANADYKDYEIFMGNHPNLSMYMVGVAPVNRGSTTAEKMGKYSVDRGTGGGYFEASNKDALKEHLTQIAQTITVKPDKVSGITVTDPLSGNVMLASAPNYSAVLTMLNSDGSVKETKVITEKISFENGILTCNYPDEIQGPFRLEISFNIQTADGVYRPNTESGYPATGGAGTDWEANTTSTGQPGYYSNGNATAGYTLNGTASSGDFPQPVVQAPQKATITLTKAWENTADVDKKPVTVELHRGSSTGDLVGTAVLNEDNGWTAACDVKFLTAEGASNEIYAVEQAVDGFTTSYSVESVVAAADGAYNITVTNTKIEVKKTATLTVTKQWKGATGTQGAVIHVCKSNVEETTFTEVENSQFTVTNGEGGTKTITLTWTEETQPKFFVYEDRSDDFYPVITGDGTARTVNIEGQQYSAMELTPQKDGNYTVTLTNMASARMPETGETGSERYVFSGLVLMFSAVLLMQIPKIKPKGGQGAPPSGEK